MSKKITITLSDDLYNKILARRAKEIETVERLIAVDEYVNSDLYGVKLTTSGLIKLILSRVLRND